MTTSTNLEHKNAQNFGDRLAATRKELGLSQKEAAERCGVRREMWGRYERGLAEPGVSVLEHFCALGADPYALFGREAPKKDEADDVEVAFAIVNEICAQLGIYKHRSEMWEIGDQLIEDRKFDQEYTTWEETSPRRRTPSPPSQDRPRASVRMRNLLLKSPLVIDDETKGRLRSVIEELEHQLHTAGKQLSARTKADAVVELWQSASKELLFLGVSRDVERYVRGLP